MQTELFEVDPLSDNRKLYARAAEALGAGALVGIPTETVYGLGADALNPEAVARIFEAKGRPSFDPLIIHVHHGCEVEKYTAVPEGLKDLVHTLASRFWPGPLTLVLPKADIIPDIVTSGLPTVAVRVSAHPAMRGVAKALGRPIAAPSANRFGRVSPTTAQHVQDELGADLLVLDGGPCDVGIESTIVDCTRGVPVLLRPGAISREQIAAVCGMQPLSKEELPALTPRASGTLEAHYAPAAKVRLMDAKALQTALDLLGADAAHIAVYARSALRTRSSKLVVRRMPDDASATAQQLFAVLRGFDDQAVKLIWIETPPATPDWEGVRDRLQRAAAA